MYFIRILMVDSFFFLLLEIHRQIALFPLLFQFIFVYFPLFFLILPLHFSQQFHLIFIKISQFIKLRSYLTEYFLYLQIQQYLKIKFTHLKIISIFNLKFRQFTTVCFLLQKFCSAVILFVLLLLFSLQLTKSLNSSLSINCFLVNSCLNFIVRLLLNYSQFEYLPFLIIVYFYK